MRNYSTSEITKLLNTMLGPTEPVADSAADHDIEDNVMTLIDVVDWCLDGVYDAARHRHSLYGSQQYIGEQAYSAMLEWKKWICNVEDELA